MDRYPSKKADFFLQGKILITEFCMKNKMEIPEVIVTPAADWPFEACAYYRFHYIAICIEKCAAIGVAGRAWSYPGNTVDRTPYGVLSHELGHYADYLLSETKGAYGGTFSSAVRRETGEVKLTNYCPNDWEWFAEMFRLFVTNPGLLEKIRPKTYRKLIQHFDPVERRDWREVLGAAPERTIKAAERKVLEALR